MNIFDNTEADLVLAQAFLTEADLTSEAAAFTTRNDIIAFANRQIGAHALRPKYEALKKNQRYTDFCDPIAMDCWPGAIDNGVVLVAPPPCL